jgi:hypothetical protein
MTSLPDMRDENQARLVSGSEFFNVIYLVILARIAKTVAIQTVLFRLSLVSFGRSLNEILFLEDVLRKFCCTNISQREMLAAAFAKDASRAHFVDRVGSLFSFGGEVLITKTS